MRTVAIFAVWIAFTHLEVAKATQLNVFENPAGRPPLFEIMPGRPPDRLGSDSVGDGRHGRT